MEWYFYKIRVSKINENSIIFKSCEYKGESCRKRNKIWFVCLVFIGEVKFIDK